MKKDIVDIVLEKEYSELTVDERAELNEICTSESEFIQLKHVFKSVESMPPEDLTPRIETKERLDQLFDQAYPKAAPIWYNSVLAAVVPKDKPIYRQPLAQIAAVALLLLLTIPLFNSNLNDENVQVANNELVEEEKTTQDANTSNIEDNGQTATMSSESDAMDTRSSEEIFLDDAEPGEEQLNESIGWTDETMMGGAMDVVSSTHPDGVFEGTITSNTEIAYSLPASESEDLLDLLTASF